MSNNSSGTSYLFPLLTLVAGVGLGGGAMWYLTPPSSKPGTTAGTSPRAGSNVIHSLGRVEPRGGLVPIFGTPGDRIVSFENHADRVGTRVAKGARLVVMASDELRVKEVALAQQQVDDARKQREAITKVADARKQEAEQEIENQQRTREAELNAQRSKIALSRQQVQQAEIQLGRVRSLSAGSVARADVDRQELQVRQAQGELTSAEELLRVAEKAFEDGKELAKIKLRAADTERDRTVQSVPLRAAELTLEAAQAKERLGYISAPDAGSVVRVQTVAGETTTQVKPILLLAVGDESLVVRSEINERDVDRLQQAIRSGQKVTFEVTSTTLKDFKLEGELTKDTQIARAMSRNAVQELAPTAGVDRRVAEALIEITTTDENKKKNNARSLELARSVLGLQVDVKLTLGN